MFTEDLPDVTDDQQTAERRLVASEATVAEIRRAAEEDDRRQLQKTQIKTGWPSESRDAPADLRDYTTLADELVIGDVLVYKGERILITG